MKTLKALDYCMVCINAAQACLFTWAAFAAPLPGMVWCFGILALLWSANACWQLVLAVED